MTVYTYIFTYTCMYIHIHKYTHTKTYTCTFIYNSCTHTNISIYTCIHINKYYNIPTSIYQSYTYTHIDTCIHIYIETDIPRRCSDGVSCEAMGLVSKHCKTTTPSTTTKQQNKFQKLGNGLSSIVCQPWTITNLSTMSQPFSAEDSFWHVTF